MDKSVETLTDMVRGSTDGDVEMESAVKELAPKMEVDAQIEANRESLSRNPDGQSEG